MIRFLIPALSLIALSSAQADDVADRHVPPPAVTNLGARPKMDIGISAKGVPSLDGVSFSDQQLAVVFRRVFMLEPKIALRIRADEKASFRHVKKVIALAKQAGITDVVFSTRKETKPGDGARQPATAVDSNSEDSGKPQPESEGRSQ